METLRRYASRPLHLLLTVAVGLFAYQTFWWKYYQRKMYQMGLPIIPLEYPWLSALGTILTARREWHRIYDLKLDFMRQLPSGFKTAAVPTPWWNTRCVVNTADPVVVKFILKDEFNSFLKTSMLLTVLRDLLGNGIFATNHGPHSEDGGAMWSLQRKTASKIFTRNQFQEFMYVVFARHAKKLGGILNGLIDETKSTAAVVEMQKYMFRYTLDSIGVIGFGQELNTLSQTHVPFAEAFDRAQKLVAYRFLQPYWNTPLGKVLYPTEREIAQHVKTLNDFAYDVIAKRRHQIKEKGVEREDILSLFLREGLDLSDTELRDVVMSFLIAGRDTTACTLTFALLLLAQNPEVQQRARMEVREHLPQDQDGDRLPNLKDLSKLKTVFGVCMESIRLYPPVPTDVKESVVDTVLPGGFPIPKNTSVSFEPYVMGRMADVWGPNPEEFKPERWSEPGFTYPSQYEFPNFQGGPRVCLGESMAKFEAQLLLCYLLDHFRFELAEPDKPVSYATGLTLSVKGGLYLKVQRL